jgi:hypothetical protein
MRSLDLSLCRIYYTSPTVVHMGEYSLTSTEIIHWNVRLPKKMGMKRSKGNRNHLHGTNA